MREREQLDHDLAGDALGQLFDKTVECPAIRFARKDLVAVDEVHQRHRFAPQAVNDVPVVDDVSVLAVAGRSSATERHETRRAEEDIEAVVIQADPQPVADEARRDRVEDLLQREAAGRGDGDNALLIVAGAKLRERLQRCALGIDTSRVASVLARDDLVDEGAIGVLIFTES